MVGLTMKNADFTNKHAGIMTCCFNDMPHVIYRHILGCFLFFLAQAAPRYTKQWSWWVYFPSKAKSGQQTTDWGYGTRALLLTQMKVEPNVATDNNHRKTQSNYN